MAAQDCLDLNECDLGLSPGGLQGPPAFRIVCLEIDGTKLHFVTFSSAPLDELNMGDLKPYPALDAAAWLNEIVEGGKDDSS